MGYFRGGSKGFRQGVLLSSYLFVLVKEDFSKFLKKGVKTVWKLLSTERAPFYLTHLRFAEDLIVFLGAGPNL